MQIIFHANVNVSLLLSHTLIHSLSLFLHFSFLFFFLLLGVALLYIMLLYVVLQWFVIVLVVVVLHLPVFLIRQRIMCTYLACFCILLFSHFDSLSVCLRIQCNNWYYQRLSLIDLCFLVC